MSQRTIVTGATGLLGRQVLQAFERAGHEVVGTGFSRASDRVRKLDIQDGDAVTKVFDEVKPDIVVHCAADRQPDSCTANPSAARKLNVQATATLASLCKKTNTFLIYISTDYVFPGREGEAPYAALSPPSPPNIYGETKYEGEKAVLDSTAHSVILRVPVLYGETEPRDNYKESAVNIIMNALWTAKSGSQVKMDDWAIRYPTNTEDVARVCVDIARLYTAAPSVAADGGAGTEQKQKKQDLPRILQFSSEDRMTKYEICQKFSEIMALSMDNVVADRDGGKPGPDGTLRPYDCHLSTKELRDLGIDVWTVDFVAWWRRYVGAFRR